MRLTPEQMRQFQLILELQRLSEQRQAAEQPLSYEEFLQQTGRGHLAAQQQPQRQKPDYGSLLESSAKSYGKKYAQDQAIESLGSSAAASGGAAAAEAAAINSAVAADLAAGTAGTAAASANTAGMTAVGTAMDGSTIYASNAAMSGGGSGGASGLGTAANAAWIAAVIAALVKAGMNYKQAKKVAKGGSLTDKEIQTVVHPDMIGEQKFLKKALPGKLGEIPLKYSPMALLGKAFLGSGKDEDQLWRDRTRRGLAEQGFTERKDGSHHVRLADGSLFDIGKDGIDAGIMGQSYNIDLNDPESRKYAGLLKPLAYLRAKDYAGREKSVNDLTGSLTNAAISNNQTDTNVRKWYADAGITDNVTGHQIIDQMGLPEEEAIRMKDALNQLYDPNYNFGETPWYMNTPEIPEYARYGEKGKQKPVQVSSPQKTGDNKMQYDKNQADKLASDYGKISGDVSRVGLPANHPGNRLPQSPMANADMWKNTGLAEDGLNRVGTLDNGQQVQTLVGRITPEQVANSPYLQNIIRQLKEAEAPSYGGGEGLIPRAPRNEGREQDRGGSSQRPNISWTSTGGIPKPIAGQMPGNVGFRPPVNPDPGFNNPAALQAPGAPGAVMIPKRSKTLSPGIGLDGKPISY